MINDNDPNSALGFSPCLRRVLPTSQPRHRSRILRQAAGSLPRFLFRSPVRLPAQIYYTTNGTTPTSASTKYTGPITIAHDTMLQTVAYSSTLTPSLVTSQQYFILDSTVASFNSNIPLVVIEPVARRFSKTAKPPPQR